MAWAIRAAPGSYVRRRPGLGVVAGGADAGEKLLQTKLRMARPEGAPTVFIQLLIEAGQHKTARRQARNDRHQIGGRRQAAGRAGGDHRLQRRALTPRFGQSVEHRVAPGGAIDSIGLGQNSRPNLDQKFEEIEHFLPMSGVALRRQFVQSGEIEALTLGLIEEAAQLLRQANRLVDLARGLACQNKLGQHELAAERRQRRWQITALGQPLSAGFVFVEIAERADARQEKRALIRLAEKCLSEGAAGAPGRQQNRDPAEGQRIIFAALDDPAMQHAIDQRIGERQFGRDGEYAGCWIQCAHSPPARDNRRPASANASGVPT